MGYKLIVQDDDKFGLFNGMSDRVVIIDQTEDELVAVWKERAAERAEQEMREWIADAKKTSSRYPKTTLKQALKDHQFLSTKGEYAEYNKTEHSDELEFDVELRERKKQLGKSQ